MRFYLTSPRFRNQMQCRHLCLDNEHYPNKINTHINKSTILSDSLKTRFSTRKAYETLTLNQFGRVNGTGGNILNNFK